MKKLPILLATLLIASPVYASDKSAGNESQFARPKGSSVHTQYKSTENRTQFLESKGRKIAYRSLGKR